MAENNQTPTTEEHVPPENGGPESPGTAPGDVVVDMDTINELMKNRNAAARETVEQTAEEHPPDLPTPSEKDTREPWEKTQAELDAENPKPRRGRPPKEAAEQTGPEGEKKSGEKDIPAIQLAMLASCTSQPVSHTSQPSK